MKNITILVPEHAILGTIEGPRLLFSEVNDYIKRMGKPVKFKVQLAALKPNTPVYDGMYTVYTPTLIQDVSKTDLIIIPAFDGDIKKALKANEAFIPWIIKQYKSGAEVASVCLGAFLLAATGLMKGRQCATHWGAVNEFRKMFPDVNLVEDKIITDEQGIYSSGGAFSYLNLILYLIEKYAGREIAVLSAKAFQIDIDRRSQSPFIIFHGQKEHEDEQIRKVQEFIESNPHEKLSVDQLAVKFALGRRNLERRFKKATANTVIEYIQRVKIEAAKKSFETSRDNINEVMYSVGYADTKAFRMVFKKFTGLSPIDYRNKYNKEMMIQ